VHIQAGGSTGGSFFGDSGGPTFYPGGAAGEKVVTVTSYGYTQNCRYLDGLQRVDIAVVQNSLIPIVNTGTAPLDYFGKV
jgi:secreted trypsin-like serine protease